MIEKREAYKHFVEHLTFVNSNPNIRLLLLSQGTEDIHQELIKSFDFPTTICITDYTQADIDKFVEVEVAELIKQKIAQFKKDGPSAANHRPRTKEMIEMGRAYWHE